MRYSVRLNDDADADWTALTPPVRRIVKARLRDLAGDPFGRRSLSLCGRPDVFRAIADGHRILFTVLRVPHGVALVNVFRIRPRAVVYEGYEFGET